MVPFGRDGRDVIGTMWPRAWSHRSDKKLHGHWCIASGMGARTISGVYGHESTRFFAVAEMRPKAERFKVKSGAVLCALYQNGTACS